MFSEIQMLMKLALTWGPSRQQPSSFPSGLGNDLRVWSLNPRKEKPTNEWCELPGISLWLNSTGVYRVNVVEFIQKSAIPDHSNARSPPPQVSCPKGETRQAQCPVKKNNSRVLSSGHLSPCGNGSSVLLDLPTFSEKMEMWNCIINLPILSNSSN